MKSCIGITRRKEKIIIRIKDEATQEEIIEDLNKRMVDLKKLFKDGKNAITHFKVLERSKDYTLLEVKIETGRTHQIRVHLSEIGYPIVGDEVYSSGKNKWGIKGQCLHAKSLKFKHPITEKQLYIEAELPEYFEKIISELKEGLGGQV